jgi:hypothetical protein
VITAPTDNAVLSGTATVEAAANCNAAYNHLLWSFGPAGGAFQTGFVNSPAGSRTGTLYTTQFPNGNYQVAAAVYLTSDTNAIVSEWSPLSYFSIHHWTSERFSESGTPEKTDAKYGRFPLIKLRSVTWII